MIEIIIYRNLILTMNLLSTILEYSKASKNPLVIKVNIMSYLKH